MNNKIKNIKGSCLIWLMPFLFFTACVSTKQSNYTFNHKKSAESLKADVVLLKKILEANHPSLYWHTSKDSLDTYFNKAINSITDSLTEVEFRNTVAAVVAQIKCGHTTVRFSANYLKYQPKHRFPQFPLYLKVWDDSLVVLANANPKDSILKRGTIVTAINGKSNRVLLDQMFAVINTDGNSNNFKNQLLSNNFSAWYQTVFGLDTAYTIEYIDSNSQKATTVIKNFKPVKDTTAKVLPTKKDSTIVVYKPTRKQKKQAKLFAKRSMQIDSSINTAYIRLTTFSSGGLRRFFRKSFKKIKEQNIENAVIDLRENGGGSVGLSTKLTKYLAKKPFKNGDSVFAINRTFPYKKHIKNWWMYWFPMNFFSHKEKDGNIHYRRFEKHYFKPQTKNHFDGNVYLIQGGITFSASTMFIGALKGQDNVTIVGEETGGGYYGNSAMHLPTIVLPNSKLRVVLPLYRLVMDKNRPKGRGIMPDIEIPPSSNAIKKGYDIKLAVLRKIIIDKKQQQKF
jgi:hypothetical protein